MAYKILYIEDQQADSRENDLKELGFEVITYDPSPNLNDFIPVLNADIKAIIMDYRLTKGANNACFDAPTLAATLRSKHSEDFKERPIILMSNEDIIIYYYKDFRNQDLFDFSLSKKDFLNQKDKFKLYLISFIEAYKKIKDDKYNICLIFGIAEKDHTMLHSQLLSELNSKTGYVYEYSRLINESIIHSIGTLIGEDILAARLGINKNSADWNKVLESLEEASYKGIFSDSHKRWWMEKVHQWWGEIIKSEQSLRRLDAPERVEIIKEILNVNIEVASGSKYSNSNNFWTICKHTKIPLDPFDGIELLKNYLPWQEKEYISFDAALDKMDNYKDLISIVDKQAVREFAKKLNADG